MKNVLALMAAVAVLVAGCASSPSGRSSASTTDDPAPATATSSTTKADRAITIGDLLADSTERDVDVVGVVLWDASGARLCEVLMESYPPQCGKPSVPINNVHELGLRYDSAHGVWWTGFGVTISGWFDGERLVVEPADHSALPLSSDLVLASILVAFAEGTDRATVAKVGFADEVILGLGDRAYRSVDSDELDERSKWVLDVDEYVGYVGPFSALDVLRAPFEVIVGPHPRCVADPTAPPTSMETFRQISIQPANATSCLEWWAVDLYLDPNGQVAGLVLDLYGP